MAIKCYKVLYINCRYNKTLNKTIKLSYTTYNKTFTIINLLKKLLKNSCYNLELYYIKGFKMLELQKRILLEIVKATVSESFKK